MTDDTNDPPRTSTTRSASKWLLVPGVRLLAESWFAWQASHELLDSYQRVHREEPELIGKTLYERIVIRRSGLDVNAAAGVLRRAEQSFCEWPSERDLKFRDVVRYIVIQEYLGSHTAVGTYTNMGKVVARVIPDHL
jgi:hypothetical protein